LVGRERSLGIERCSSGAYGFITSPYHLHECDMLMIEQIIGSFPVPVYPHITPDSWTIALDNLNRLTSPIANDGEEDVAEILDEGVPTIALVKGPKRAGKSTVARAALNRLLDAYERVAWLECDLGQGEFGCGGVVGLWVIDRPILGTWNVPPSRVETYRSRTVDWDEGGC
jgi:polynucleotide 5'-hydroxyl-kinase GRC3/NOL9